MRIEKTIYNKNYIVKNYRKKNTFLAKRIIVNWFTHNIKLSEKNIKS